MNNLSSVIKTIKDNPFNFEWNGQTKTTPNEVVSVISDYIRHYQNLNLLDYGWTPTIDSAKRRAGVCRYGKKNIGISRWLIDMNTISDVEDTIKHEMGHAIAYGQLRERGHGYVWKMVARTLGDSGERCYDANSLATPKAKYSLTCPKCDYEYKRHRKPRRTEISCGKCGNGYYNEKYKLVVKQNF